MIEINRSKYYSFHQATADRAFLIDFGHKTVRLSLCQLLSLRHKLKTIAIEDHFDGDLNKHGFEILLLCNKEHLFILNTLEILDLTELVESSLVKLGLAQPAHVALV